MFRKINIYDGERFDFAEHINEFLIRREEAQNIESFLVVVEHGKKTHLHKHLDMEQLFFIVSGCGRITTDSCSEWIEIEKNDIVYIPIGQLHQIFCTSEEPLVYLTVNAFLSLVKQASTSLTHASRVVENYAMDVPRSQRSWRKPILIAGSSGYIGHAIAKHYLKQRNYVIGLDTHAGIENFGIVKRDSFFERIVDLTDDEQVENHLKALYEQSYVLPRALICAAGITDLHRNFIETNAATVVSQFNANFLTNYNVARAYARILIDAKSRGTIVFVGSVGASKAHRGQCAYDAMKAAAEGLCRAMALELAPHGINVNTLALGPLEDSPSSRKDIKHRRALRDLVPIGRYGLLDEACEIIEAITAINSPYFTGQTITVDGGLTIQLRPRNIERINDD